MAARATAKSGTSKSAGKGTGATPGPDASGNGLEWNGPSIADEPSLRDIVVAEMMTNRHPERPIVSRMALVGEVVAKDDPPRQLFEDVVATACARVNAEDPFNGKTATSSEPTGVTGFIVIMPSHFFAMLESEPAHLLEVARELNDRLNVRKTYDAIRAVHVCYSVDDVVARGLPKWSTIEAALNPSQTASGRSPEEVVVDCVSGLLQIGKACASHTKVQLDSFLQSVRSTHAQHIPRANAVERILECGLCPSLPEYVGLFGSLPVIRRPSEQVYPMEPPVVY